VADPANGTLTFANAGHPHAFLVTQDAVVTRLEATRPPLGLGDGGQEGSKSFERGKAVLCLFTDGLADARGPSGERFGEQRVLSHVVNLRARPARHILEAVFTDIAAFTGGAPANDDRTLGLLKVCDGWASIFSTIPRSWAGSWMRSIRFPGRRCWRLGRGRDRSPRCCWRGG